MRPVRKSAFFGIVTPVRDGRMYFRACAASLQRAAKASESLRVAHYVQESAASRQSCADIAEQFGCRYSSSEDSGLYDAIARGLDSAANDGCEYLGWLNCDEQYLEGALAAAQRVFESNANISIVFGDYLMLNSSGIPIAARREIPARRIYLRNGVNYLLSCTVFFRREVWQNVGPFDLSYKLLADKKFYLRALDAGYKASLIPQYIGAYTQTGGNASLSPDAIAEQSRLRMEDHAWLSPLARRCVRLFRVADKLLHGCYFPEMVDTSLYAPSGELVHYRSRLSPFWQSN